MWWCGAVGERVMGMDESTDDNCDPIGGRGAVKRVRSTQLGVKGDGGALIRCLSVCACACGCVGVVVPTYILRSIDTQAQWVWRAQACANPPIHPFDRPSVHAFIHPSIVANQ